MITKDYKQTKDIVLSTYENYTKLCEEFNEKLPDNLQEQAEKIKNEIFNLMIIGEAKSGKSTFINAFLGQEVVPMDVRQCTSAIIKIQRGPEIKLVATTASGNKSTIAGNNNVRTFLKEKAAIVNDFRNIPITTINNELLIKYQGKNIPQKVLEGFMEGVEKENIYNLEMNDYNSLIMRYIESEAANWGNIITEIDITYPLPEAMAGITLIDSPGIGAGGNVGVIAEEYIEQANAIVFVKSLNGQALESSSFLNFFKNNCLERSKNTLFLVFTGKSNLAPKDFDSLREQANDMFKKDIQESKILFVDSKLELLLKQCKELGTAEKIENFLEEMSKNGELDHATENIWLKSKSDPITFFDKLKDESQFHTIHSTIENFARVASYIQLEEFVKNLQVENERYIVRSKEILGTIEGQLSNPSEIEHKIAQKQNESDEIFIKINEEVAKVLNRYVDNISNDAIIFRESKALIDDYKKKLETFSNLSENNITDATFDQMKKVTMDTIDKTVEFRMNITKRIIDECNQKLIECSGSVSASVYTPNFTRNDFEKLELDAKNKSTSYKDISKGKTNKKTAGRTSHWEKKKHVGLVLDSITSRLDVIVDAMIENLLDFSHACVAKYKNELTSHKKSLDNELQELLKVKEDNEKIKAKYDNLNAEIQRYQQNSKTLSDIEKELANYVNK